MSNNLVMAILANLGIVLVSLVLYILNGSWILLSIASALAVVICVNAHQIQEIKKATDAAKVK